MDLPQSNFRGWTEKRKMNLDEFKGRGLDEEIKFQRKRLEKKLHRLNDYTKNYSTDKFMEDFLAYFDNEVDFDLKKVRQIIGQPKKLEHLIKKAAKKGTHPIREFLQEIFKEMACE